MTIARSASGSPRSASSRAEPTNSCVVSDVASSTGSPTPTPAAMRDSATRNRYAGPDPLSRGHRVELGLGDAHDEADRAEDGLGPHQVVLAGAASGGDGRGALADEGRRVGHGAHHGDGRIAERGLDRRGRDARRDRQHASDAGRHLPLAPHGDVAGLHGDHRPVGRDERLADVHPGELGGQLLAPLADGLAHRQRRGVATAGEQPAEQRRPHVAAADDDQLMFGHTTNVATTANVVIDVGATLVVRAVARTDIPDSRRPGHLPGRRLNPAAEREIPGRVNYVTVFRT